MRIVLRIGPPSYNILVRSCVSLCCCCTVVCGLRSFKPSETKAASRWLFTYMILPYVSVVTYAKYVLYLLLSSKRPTM